MLFSILIFSIKSLAQDEWLNFELGRVGQITIQLKVKKYACAADTNWIGFEFDNNSTDTLFIDKWISYFIERTADGWTGNLSHEANFYPFEKLSYDKYAIPPGTTKLYTPLSNEGSNMLGIPENRRDTFPVECTLRFNFPPINNESLDIKDYKFTFFWYYPTDEQFKFLTQRLEKIINKKEENREPNEWYFHAMIIEVPKITDAIPLSNYIGCLDSLEMDAWGGIRHKTIQYIDKKYNQNIEVVNYFRNALRNDYETIVDDLFFLENISLVLVDEIFHYYQRHIEDDYKRIEIIRWFNQQKKAYPNSILNKKRKNFFDVLVQSFPVIKTSSDTVNIKELRQWAEIVPNIEQIGDTTAIKYLTPFLKNKVKINDPNSLKTRASGAIIVERIRVCDFALEAIYNLQGRNREFMDIYKQYVKRGDSVFYKEQEMENFYAIIENERNKLISELIKQFNKKEIKFKRLTKNR